MTRPYTHTSPSGRKWARYNARRAKDRAYAQSKRLQKQDRRRVDRERSEMAEAAHAAIAAALPTSASSVHALTMEVIIRAGGTERVMRAVYDPNFGWRGDSGNLMCRQIRVVREALAA